MYIAETGRVQGHTNNDMFLTWLTLIKFSEIYIQSSDCQSIFFCRKSITKKVLAQGYTKVPKYSMANEGKFFKLIIDRNFVHKI